MCLPSNPEHPRRDCPPYTTPSNKKFTDGMILNLVVVGTEHALPL